MHKFTPRTINRQHSTITSQFHFYILLIVFILNSLGFRQDLFNLIGLVVLTVYISISRIFVKLFVFPKYFIWHFVFLVVLFVDYIYLHPNSDGNFLYLFTSGTIVMLLANNFQVSINQKFTDFVLSLTILLSIIFIFLNYILHLSWVSFSSLVLYSSGVRNHLFLGDLWSIALLMLIKPSPYIRSRILAKVGTLITGIVFLVISESRSAYLSILTGILVLKHRNSFGLKLPRYVYYLLSGLFVSVFLLASLDKSLLFSRPYYYQSIVIFSQNPFGVGMGNFGDFVSRADGFDVNTISAFTHNIFLEILVGLGIWSLPFFVWWALVFRQIFMSARNNNLTVAVFMALIANFTFNATYLVPSLVWIMYICVGLIIGSNKTNSKYSAS